MAKAKASTFFCQECGYESAKWMGQCPGCREWNTYVEEVVDRSTSASAKVKKALSNGKFEKGLFLEYVIEGDE